MVSKNYRPQSFDNKVKKGIEAKKKELDMIKRELLKNIEQLDKRKSELLRRIRQLKKEKIALSSKIDILNTEVDERKNQILKNVMQLKKEEEELLEEFSPKVAVLNRELDQRKKEILEIRNRLGQFDIMLMFFGCFLGPFFICIGSILIATFITHDLFSATVISCLICYLTPLLLIGWSYHSLNNHLKFHNSRIQEILAELKDIQSRTDEKTTKLSSLERKLKEMEKEKDQQIAEIKVKLKEIETEEERTKSRFERVKKELETEIKMLQKGLIPFVDRHGNKRWGTPSQVKQWKIMDMDIKNRFRILKPREFERLIMKLFVNMGYETRLTPYIADFGADLIVKKGTDTIVVQVKKYGSKHKVGSPEVQKLLGSMFKYKANKAIFITTSDFTKEARQQARYAPIKLWNYTVLTEKMERYLLNFLV